MDMIFGNPLRETFRGGGGIGIGGLGLGVRPRILVTNDAPSYYFEQSDDEPLFFNWFNKIMSIFDHFGYIYTNNILSTNI